MLLVLALPLFVLAVLRVTGIDGNRYTIAALAMTPYVAVGGALLGVVALLLRRWWTGAVVILLVVALGVVVLPRMYAADQPGVQGRSLRVMALNLRLGNADPKAVVDLVKANRVDVLSLLELNQAEADALDQAGLFGVLPQRLLHPAPGASGSGLASAHPLTERKLAGDSQFAQPGAVLDLGDGAQAEVVAVHTLAPVVSAATWADELAGLPEPTADLPVRILAGDFNATLDHAAFRGLLRAGYADAADERGEGFKPTWPGELFPPPVTIDHVLVDDRVAVRDYRVFDVPGTDHDAVFADLSIPV